jgi:hypothetical protein
MVSQKWCQVPQSDFDELFIYKFVGPSPLCAKDLYTESMALMTAAAKMVSQKWCQVPQSDIDELFIYKFVSPSPLCAKDLYTESMAWMTAEKSESSALSTCGT